MERRFVAGDSIKVETREDGTSTISGYGAVFYREGDESTEFRLADNVVEHIQPGAFDRALEESDDVRGLFNHDPSQLLGRTSSGTMTLSVDKRGLRYDIDVPGTRVGQDVVESIKRGDLSGSSFAFTVDAVDWSERDGTHIREIRAVHLFDTGPVTYPAYEATTTGLRSRTMGDDWRQELKEWTAHQDRIVQDQMNLLEARSRLAAIDAG